jgi:hypothetical protein
MPSAQWWRRFTDQRRGNGAGEMRLTGRFALPFGKWQAGHPPSPRLRRDKGVETKYPPLCPLQGGECGRLSGIDNFAGHGLEIVRCSGWFFENGKTESWEAQICGTGKTVPRLASLGFDIRDGWKMVNGIWLMSCVQGECGGRKSAFLRNEANLFTMGYVQISLSDRWLRRETLRFRIGFVCQFWVRFLRWATNVGTGLRTARPDLGIGPGRAVPTNDIAA